MSLTTIPAFIISFLLFAFLSPDESVGVANLDKYMAALEETGLIFWTSWIPLIVLILATIFKIPAFISLAVSSMTATILAGITSEIAWTDIWAIWFNGYTATTGFEPVNSLLTKGGINSMLFTISLVILALGFGGLLFVTGIVPSILSAFQENCRNQAIIASTAATAIGVNVLIGEQYLSIMLTGETFKGVYQKPGCPTKHCPEHWKTPAP